MKRNLLYLIAFILLVTTGVNAQTIVGRSGAANTVRDWNLMAGNSFFLPRFADTTAANAATDLDTAGKVIFTTSDNKMWKRKVWPKVWEDVGAIYTSGFGIGIASNVVSVDSNLVTSRTRHQWAIDSLAATIGTPTLNQVLGWGNISPLAARVGGLDFEPNGYFRFPARASDDPSGTPEGTVYYDTSGNIFRGQLAGIFYNFLTSAERSTDTSLGGGASNILIPTERAVWHFVRNNLNDYLLLQDIADTLDNYGWQVKSPLYVITGSPDSIAVDTTHFSFGLATKWWVRDTLASLGLAGGYTDGYGLLLAGNEFSVDTSFNMIATKAYVDSAVMGGGSSSYTFTNGLTNSSGTVSLGGALTGATTITNTNTNTLSVLNNTDNASVQVLKLEGDRTTVTANDEGYVSYMLSDGATTQTEYGRFSWVATSVTNTSEAGRLDWAVMTAGTLADELFLSGTILGPSIAGGLNLGSTALPYGSAYLETTLDFSNDIQITRTALNTLKFQNSDIYYFDDDVLPFDNNLYTLGSFNRMWTTLYLGSTGVVNWNNGNATITHSTGLLTSNVDFVVPTEVFGVGWNGSNEVPTKDAVYDIVNPLYDSLGAHRTRLIALEAAGGGGVSDGDKGDITVSASGATWTIDANAVTLGKMAQMATASLLGRNTAGTGDVEVLSAATARTLLGLVIGTNVQAYDADLTTYAGITPSANVQTFLGAADYAAMRTQLGLVIGTNVQAYDAGLTSIGGVATTGALYYLSAADTWTAVTIGSGLSFTTGTLSATGSAPAYGTDNQIPVMNAAGTAFEYSANFTYNGTNVYSSVGFIAGDGKYYMNSADLTDNYIDFNNDVANTIRIYNQDGDIHLTTAGTASLKLLRGSYPLLVAGSGANSYVGLGVNSADRPLHVEFGDGVTNAVTNVNRFTHYTSAGTVATGFGIGNEFELENASGTNVVAGSFEFAWTDATNASEDASFKLRLIKAGTLTDALTVSSIGELTVASLDTDVVPSAPTGTVAPVMTDGNGRLSYSFGNGASFYRIYPKTFSGTSADTVSFTTEVYSENVSANAAKDEFTVTYGGTYHITITGMMETTGSPATLKLAVQRWTGAAWENLHTASQAKDSGLDDWQITLSAFINLSASEKIRIVAASTNAAMPVTAASDGVGDVPSIMFTLTKIGY